jgi:hypothetical protein
MASNGEESGGDFVLASRHAVVMFLLFVVVLGVVFTPGCLSGGGQCDSRLCPAVGKPLEAGPLTTGSPLKSRGKAECEEPPNVPFTLGQVFA